MSNLLGNGETIVDWSERYQYDAELEVNRLCEAAFNNAELKGFNKESEFSRFTSTTDGVTYVQVPEDYFNIMHMGLHLSLMHSELSEALEAVRSKDPAKNNVGEELADCVIRILHHCGDKGIDLGKEIVEKMKVNAGREFMHGKRA